MITKRCSNIIAPRIIIDVWVSSGAKSLFLDNTIIYHSVVYNRAGLCHGKDKALVVGKAVKCPVLGARHIIFNQLMTSDASFIRKRGPILVPDSPIKGRHPKIRISALVACQQVQI